MKKMYVFFTVLLLSSACAQDVTVANVYLNKNNITLTIGEKFNLDATVIPEDAATKTVSWNSNKPTIASVSDNGQVTALAFGTAIITVTTHEGNKTAECVVTVNEKGVDVTEITLDKTEAALKVGETVTLKASVKPDNATNAVVSWKSDSPSVATVVDGLVTAIGPGTATITVTATDGSNKTAESKISVTWPELSGNRIIVAYVIAGVSSLPDPTNITHINYAFGEVNSTFNGIKVNNESRLLAISGLKQQKPSLKVLLAIGGWEKGGFSEMASDPITRKAFATDCKRVVDQFNLDGIDMDWEYPTSSMAGIVSSPADKGNFTLLMGEIRAAIGNDKLLTFASSSTAGYVDFKAVDPYVDYINIMTYDIARPPYHQAGLYRSQYTSGRSCDESVMAHYNAGVPMKKLTLGIPFYGHGCCGLAADVAYKDVVNLNYTTYTKKWDDVAKAPYLTNSAGEYVLTYDDPQSIAAKCEYIQEKGMLGAMYWQYSHDDANGSLRNAVYNGLMKVK